MAFNITVFGTCRVESLSNYNLRIRDEISYTYDTKEILEVIRFIKHGHVPPEETITTFRTPMISKIPIYSNQFKDILEDTDLFIIEICGKKTYKYINRYIHSALPHFSNESISKQIIIDTQSNDEIESDIVEIITQLNTTNIIVVGHIVTDSYSNRYDLLKTLESLCIKYNISFINPVLEISKKGYDIKDLVQETDVIYHYNDNGHSIIHQIYEEYIDKYRHIQSKA